MIEKEQKLELPPQRPDLGIDIVTESIPVTVTQEQFPWITGQAQEVPTIEVTLDDGNSFRYGSLISSNKGLVKLADSVPAEKSKNAEQGMFKALPAIIAGQPAQSVERMTQYVATDIPVYKTAKNSNDVARLFFATYADEKGGLVVLKLGISSHKKQAALLGILKDNPRAAKRKAEGRKK